LAKSQYHLHGFDTLVLKGAQFMENKLLVVTTNDIPGYKVVETYGEVFGLIVRSRNMFSNIDASFRTIFGGEVKGYTRLLSDSREHALERLRQAAADKGANAVLAMRFDSGDIGGVMNEVAAYGTAVKIKKV
jgi:uncharacterized protein YbjQ (UPF0145 family)